MPLPPPSRDHYAHPCTIPPSPLIFNHQSAITNLQSLILSLSPYGVSRLEELSTSHPHIHHPLARRVHHLPTVTFGGGVIFVVVRCKGKRLFANGLRVLLHCPKWIVVDKFFMLQFGANGVVDMLLQRRRITRP